MRIWLLHMQHIDNDYDEAPKAAGMKALLLDREGKTEGAYIIRSLSGIKERI